MSGYTGSSTLAAPKEVKKDPNVLLGEILAYLRYSYRPSTKYRGTALFEVPKTDVNEHLIFYIRCDPDKPVETGFGMPPDGKYSVWTTMSRDDFFYLYSGDAGPGAVASMLLTGRLTVRWLNFAQLKSFAASFDYSNTNWVAFYRTHDMPAEVMRMMQLQWSRADAQGAKAIVKDDGSIVIDESITPEARSALRAQWHPSEPAAEAVPSVAAIEVPADEINAADGAAVAAKSGAELTDASQSMANAGVTTATDNTAESANARLAADEPDAALVLNADALSSSSSDALLMQSSGVFAEESQTAVLRDIPYLAEYALRATLARAAAEGAAASTPTEEVTGDARNHRGSARDEEFGAELFALLPALLHAPRSTADLTGEGAPTQSLLDTLAPAASTRTFNDDVIGLVDLLEVSLADAAAIDRVYSLVASAPPPPTQSFSPAKMASAAGSVIDSVGFFARELIAPNGAEPPTAAPASPAQIIIMSQFREAQDAARSAAANLRELLASAQRVRSVGRTLAGLAEGRGQSASYLALLGLCDGDQPRFCADALRSYFSRYTRADERAREKANSAPNMNPLAIALVGLKQVRNLCGVPDADGSSVGAVESARVTLSPVLQWAVLPAPERMGALFRRALPDARIVVSNDVAQDAVRERLRRAVERYELPAASPRAKPLASSRNVEEKSSAIAFASDVFGLRGAHADSEPGAGGTRVELMEDDSPSPASVASSDGGAPATDDSVDGASDSEAHAGVDGVAARWHAAHGDGFHPLSPLTSFAPGRGLHAGLLWLPAFGLDGVKGDPCAPSPLSLLSPDAIATLSAWARAREGAARVLTSQALETCAWALGAWSRPFARAPLTLDAVEEGSNAVLISAWLVRRLLLSDNVVAPDSAPQARAAPSLHRRPHTSPPLIYNGWGSALFYSTARARVEITLADSIDEARASNRPLSSFFSAAARAMSHFARGSALSKFVGGDGE